VRQGFFGQEPNLTTYNLARINMFLHDINYEKFDLAHGDTLMEPAHWDDEPFEAIVSNPPYSIKWEGDANPLLINDPRFAPAGVLAPKSKADLAFTMHILSWLAVNGTAAIVQFPGVLSRGRAEKKIRKYLIDNNYIDAVIQLPDDLFFGTPIDTCIVVLKKSKTDNAVLFIDGSAEFTRVGNKNKLTEPHRERILAAYTARRDKEHFAKLVPSIEIADNDYNIAVSSYVQPEDTREEVNITELNGKIARIVARQGELRTQIDATVADLEARQKQYAHYRNTLLGGAHTTEYKALGELLDYEQPGPYLVASQAYSDEFSIPVLTAGQTFVLGYTDETSGIYPASMNSPVIIFDDFTTAHKWVDFPFKAKSGAMKMLTIKQGAPALLRFVFYAMSCINYVPAGHARHWISKYSQFKIPVPPLHVQQDIVRTLDSFDALVNGLSDGLPAELAARRQQYEYYRDRLLTFEEAPA
jgi:hypothetical protein